MMGNQVGVCSEPPELYDLFCSQQQRNETGNFGKQHDRQPPQDDGFRSHLQIWRFYAETGDDVLIRNAPVRFSQFKKFDSKDCYIALHVIKGIAPEVKANISPRFVESPRNNSHNPSLCDLLASSMEELTPRGTSCSFGTLSLEPFIHNTNDEYTHDLYVWNGKNSSSLAKAVALAKGFEIERILMKEKLTGSLYHQFARMPKVPLSSHFMDDLANFKQDSRIQFDLQKYESNHIYKQLIGANRKLVGSVKIGELFGTPADGPRYEVLKKLVLAQPNGLVATRTTDPPTRHPNHTKTPMAKIPPLNIVLKDSPTSIPTPTPTPHFISTPTPTSPAPMPTPAPTPLAIVPTETPKGVPFLKVSSLKLHSSTNIEPRPVARVPSLPILSHGRETENIQEQAPVPQPEMRSTLSRILDYLYLGGQKPAMDRTALHKAGITHVLNCAGGVCKDYFPDEFVYKTYDIGDGLFEDITCLFYESLEFIESALQNNGKVFIHCHQGISRSSAFVICYLMWKNNWSFIQAHEFTKKGTLLVIYYINRLRTARWIYHLSSFLYRFGGC